MAFATQQNGFRTSVQSSRTAPFRSGPTPPRRVARVVTTATQEPVSDLTKKAAAAFVAATIALSPMSATAAGLGGILDQAGAAKDQAAGAVKSATGNKAGGNAQGVSGAIKDATASRKKGVESAPSIGEALENAAGNINPDAKRVAGSARQGAKDLQNQPNVGFWGSSSNLQVSVGAPSVSGTIDDMKKAGKKGVETAPSIGEAAEKLAGNVNKDAKQVVGSARQGAKDVQNQPNVGFWGDAAALQTNVGLPSAGGLADKAKAAGDKVAGAAKDATGSASGPLQGAKGDAKSALGDAKQGVKNLKDQPNVGFWGDAAGLQTNVGLPSAGGLADKAKAAGDKVAGAAKDATGSASGPLQGAKGDAKSALGDAKQGVKNLKNQPNVGFWGDSSSSLQVNVDAAYGGGGDKPASATDKSTGAAQDLTDQTAGPKASQSGDAKTVEAAKQGVKNLKNQPMVGFNGRTDGLQMNVGLPSAGGLADKAKAAGDKVAGAAKDATGSASGPLQGAKGDAKSALGDAKQGVKNMKDQPNVGFWGDAAGLQKNIDFPVKLQDKAKASKEKVAQGNKSSTDGGQRAGSDALQGAFDGAKQGAEKLKKGVRFSGSAAVLQQNVDFPVKLQDKAKASKEKVAEGNKSSSDGGNRAGSDALQGAFDGAKQGAEKLKKGVRFSGSAAGLQQNVDFPVKLQDKAKASKDKVAEGNKSSSDGGQRAGSDALQGAFSNAKDAATGAKQAAKKQAGVAYSGASGLQVNVGLPSAGGLADKAKAAGDKVAGAAKDATGSASGPLQGAKGDAKSALGDAKQGVKDLKNQPNVAFNGSAAGLQKNVGQTVFGRGEVGTTKDQTFGAIEEAKDNVANPVQNTKNALDRTGQEANRVLSNPTGGPEQSKRAAQQLSDANAEIPKALAGGAQKVKDAVASPASFSDFGTAALQRGAALEA